MCESGEGKREGKMLCLIKHHLVKDSIFEDLKVFVAILLLIGLIKSSFDLYWSTDDLQSSESLTKRRTRQNLDIQQSYKHFVK